MKKTIGLCVLVVLMGCSDKKSIENEAYEPQEDPTQFKEVLEVHPEMLGFHAYELGELIKNLMLEDKGDESTPVWDWDLLANDQKIRWMTEGLKENYNTYTMTTMTTREGYARIHLLGERVSQLKDRKYEVPWKISYAGAEAKFGVNTITLQPVSDLMLSFNDPEPSLKKQSIKLNVICEQSFAGEHIKVTQLSLRKKQPVYLIDRSSGGSGGESRWLELSLQDLSTEWCADQNEGIETEFTEENSDYT